MSNTTNTTTLFASTAEAHSQLCGIIQSLHSSKFWKWYWILMSEKDIMLLSNIFKRYIKLMHRESCIVFAWFKKEFSRILNRHREFSSLSTRETLLSIAMQISLLGFYFLIRTIKKKKKSLCWFWGYHIQYELLDIKMPKTKIIQIGETSFSVTEIR